MLPKTVAEVVAHAGGLNVRLTKAEHKFIRRAAGTKAIIVTDKEDTQKGFCLCCNKKVILAEKTKHAEKMRCPSCAEEVQVKHLWRNMLTVHDRATFYIYRRSVINPQAVVAILLVCQQQWHRHYGQEIQKMRFEVEFVDSITLYLPGEGDVQIKPLKGQKIWETTYDYDNGCRRKPIEMYEVERRAPRCREASYFPNGYSNYCYKEELLEVAAGTPFSYGLKEYMPYAEDGFITYLHRLHKWPAYEWLCKMGLGCLVGKELKGHKEYYEHGVQCINWRGKRLDKILKVRLTKAEKKFLLDREKKYLEGTAFYHDAENIIKAKQNYPDIPLQELSCIHGLYRFGDIEGITARKLAKYAASLGELYMSDYYDYLRQLDQLNLPRNKKTLFPKNFAEVHTRLSERIKQKESMVYEDKYRVRRRQLRGLYRYANDEYCIICPPKVSMLIKEGELQHNCVGTYMKRVSEGNTNVVFLRKKTDWRTPFGTVEINNDGHVVQARAAYNKPLPETARAFVAKFAETVKKRIAENKKKGKKAA